MEESRNIHTSPIHTGERHFKFFTDLDAVLLQQDAANAEQAKWALHDALLDVVIIPVGEDGR